MRRLRIARAFSSCLLGVLLSLSAAPGWAITQLTNWQFDPRFQQLALFTDGPVQPKVSVVENPVRIIIDLPSTDLLAPSEIPMSGPVRSLRAGQFDPETTRLVLEMAEGEAVPRLDQVQLRHMAPRHWLVQLPTTVPPPPVPLPRPTPEPPVLTPLPPAVSRGAQLFGIETTAEGFLLKTTGPVRADVRRLEEQPPRVVVDLDDTRVSQDFPQRTLSVNQFGVERLRTGQFQVNPPVTRIVLDLKDAQVTWEARYSAELGGVMLKPAGVATPAPPAQGPVIALRSAELTPEGLVFTSDEPVRLVTGWENPNEYRLVFNPAQLPENFSGPALSASSPINNLNISQVDERTVLALVRVQPGLRVGDPRPLDTERRRILLPLISQPEPVPSTQVPVPPGSKLLVLDAGHGGQDPGAIRVGIHEKNLTLGIVQRLDRKLREQGFYTALTRPDDTFISLGGRVNVASANRAALFISIHINAMERRNDIQGIETYYTHPNSARLAYTLHRRLVERTGKPDRGVRTRRLYVTNHTSMPAALLEVGFISNPQEREQLLDPNYQDIITDAVVQGVREYLGQ